MHKPKDYPVRISAVYVRNLAILGPQILAVLESHGLDLDPRITHPGIYRISRVVTPWAEKYAELRNASVKGTLEVSVVELRLMIKLATAFYFAKWAVAHAAGKRKEVELPEWLKNLRRHHGV